MKLFLKGFIIGIGKIIPGVSGAMIAVSFSVYDSLINAITNFFGDKKSNLKFLLIIGSGIFLSIIFCSNVVRFLINRYYFIMMMLFIGLIVGGTYKFSKNIKYNLKNIVIIVLVSLLVLIVSLLNVRNSYILKGNYLDYIMFFIGGIIEVFSSIIPGISGTALFMLLGIYDNILMLFSNIYNVSFVLDNIILYISYGTGMILSFLTFSLIVSYLLKKYRSLFDTIVLGLSIASIVLLIIMAFKNGTIIYDLFVGIFLFIVGIIISYFFS